MNSTAKTIIDAVKPLADKIGEGAAHLYTIYVRQAYIEGVTFLSVGIPSALLIMGVSIVFFNFGKKIPQDYAGDMKDSAIFLYFVSAILFITGFIVLIVCATNGIQYLLNPEYQAVQNIINTVKENN